MKTKTDLKAGISMVGTCTPVYNKYGRCKKIVCPYPPYNFPCPGKRRIWPGATYTDHPGEPDGEL
jgi:hypothetical protein